VEVAERKDEIGARIACITFADPARLDGFQRKMQLPYGLFSDPERETYQAFGFERASLRRVWLDPRVWWRYAQLMARGRRLQAGEEDTLQLGGDAVLDGEGRLTWLYRSRGPEDRPAVDELVDAVSQAG
jgi:hypothetical protein